MKYIVGFSRVFVGILFIISGFIKLNDPVGFSFKLEEYFSQGVLDLPFFEPHALSISILVVIFEVLVGVMLLVGFRVKFTVWSLLLMIVGFNSMGIIYKRCYFTSTDYHPFYWSKIYTTYFWSYA